MAQFFLLVCCVGFIVCLWGFFYRSAKQKISIQSLHQQIQVLEKQNVQLKQNLSSSAVTTCSCNNPGPSSTSLKNNNANNAGFGSLGYDDPEGSSSLPGSQIVPQQATCRKQLRYSVAKFFEIKEGNCRVGAYNEWMNMMVVSHDVKSSLFPSTVKYRILCQWNYLFR